MRIFCLVENDRLNLFAMNHARFIAGPALVTTLSVFADAPKHTGIGATMQEMIAKNEIAGSVTPL